MKTGRPATGVPPEGEALAAMSDGQLVQLLVGGDETALAALYDRFGATVYRTALLRLGDRQLAEEVLQDTYLALWNRAELFDPDRGSLVAWLATIARNRATDRLRSLGRRPSALPLSAVLDTHDPERPGSDGLLHRAAPVAGVTPAPDPERTVDETWLRGEVESALAGIPPMEQQVLYLAYYEELTQSEIAARLQWPLGTVKTRTRRALRHLRQKLSLALGPELGARYATEDESDGPS